MRRLLLIACVSTSLLGLTASALWIHSYRQGPPDTCYLSTDSWILYLGSVEGQLFLNCARFAGKGPRSHLFFCPVGPRWVFECETHREWRYLEVACPHWFVMVSGGSGALVCVALARRYRRQPASGLCSKCGYDLRASPERCPECGTLCEDLNTTADGPSAATREGADLKVAAGGSPAEEGRR